MNCGSKVWYIPDAYWPEISNGVYPSHEAVCVLNPGNTDVSIELTLFFEDRDKMTGFKAVCKAGRTNHIRLDRLKNENGQSIPRGVPYALMVNSSSEIIAQYSRLDSTQAEMALMTTMAYPVRE
ncbi:MAG: sensory rhodopsin transducer [Clostridiaceae bacterium]